MYEVILVIEWSSFRIFQVDECGNRQELASDHDLDSALRRARSALGRDIFLKLLVAQ